MHQEYYGDIETETNNIFKKKEDNGYDMRRGFQFFKSSDVNLSTL